MNETQIEKEAQREANRMDQFQQRKLAEELTNGTVLRNAALEHFGHKIKAEEIITVSAKAEGEEEPSIIVKPNTIYQETKKKIFTGNETKNIM